MEDIHVDTGSFNKLFSTKATFHEINVGNFCEKSYYVDGIDFTLLPKDGVSIIYVNPIKSSVNIHLGVEDNHAFECNRKIIIKDVTLEFGSTSSNNINIWAIDRIEQHSYGLTATNATPYIINSVGGSVSFRFFRSGVPGNKSTWIIESEFIGNKRLPLFAEINDKQLNLLTHHPT